MIKTSVSGFIFIITLIALIACGRKGAPKPPEDFAPEPVKNVNAIGSVDGIAITWEAPDIDPDADEDKIIPLAGFVVQRADFSRDRDPTYEVIKEIPLNSPDDKTFSYTDSKVEPGKIYNYQVLPFNTDEANGEPGFTVRVTFLGENSRIERVIEGSKRPDKKKLNADEDLY